MRPALISIVLAAASFAACATPSASAPAGSTGIGTATASPTPIRTPSVTPTRALAGEPIASTAALSRDQLPLVEFSRADKAIASLPIEVPPPSEYTVGLSGRPSLSDERGMLFYYQQMARGAFWMKDTHFDLSIAFVASDETIVDIIEMHAESTAIVTPRADYQYAIEAPAGWYSAHDVHIGDRAHLAFPLPKSLSGR